MQTILRQVGDAGIKPGDSQGFDMTVPASMKVIETLDSEIHVPVTYAPFVVDEDVTSIRVWLRRSHILGNRDPYLLSAFIDLSLDLGKTWGGAFRDLSQGQVPGGFSMQNMATFGMDEGHGMGDAYFEMPLPPDQGMGRLVRISVGSKSPIDVGIYYTLSTEKVPLRQLMKDLHHSVALDVATGFASYNGSTTLSVSHAGAASPTDYYARVAASYTSVSSPVSTGVYDSGGAALALTDVTGAKLTRSDFQTTIFGLCNMLYRINPTAGTVTVTLSNGGNAMYGKGSSVSTWTGVNQSTPNGTTVTFTSASTFTPACSVTAATTSAITDAMAFGQVAEATTVVPGQTDITSGTGAGGQGGGSQRAAGTGSALSMSWTISQNTGRPCVQSACEILQASAGGNPLYYQSQLNGLGSGGRFFQNPLG